MDALPGFSFLSLDYPRGFIQFYQFRGWRPFGIAVFPIRTHSKRSISFRD
jgi:hypothetical protein